MFKHVARSLTLALTLAVLTMSSGRVFAPPSAVAANGAPTGTDPEPQGLLTHAILSFLGLA
jgi:hypothetical protein